MESKLPYVKLIAYTQTTDECSKPGMIAEQVSASAANLCYNPIGASEILSDMTNEKATKLIKQVVSTGHTSTIEHMSFTFAVEGISRATSHQLVRHRIASYSQQSQRYVEAGDFNYIVPPSIAQKPDLKEKYERFMDYVNETYKDFLAYDIPAEDARFVLPNAAETKIVVTMNARSLLHFFEERCCGRAQWEIRTVANMMLAECRKVAPVMFEKAGPTCVTKGICEEGKRSCGLLAKLKNKQ